ncbi:MAG: selenide, water dikinase SelD [Pseudomonadales bacterium]
MNSVPFYKHDLVLLGGGHAHVLAIKSFAMKAIPEVRITLVSEQGDTPYSGMLPGYIAGHFEKSDTLINLNALCRAAGIRFIKGRVIDLELDAREVHIENQAPLSYDCLSIDTGSCPSFDSIEGYEYATGVKPIAQFHRQWAELEGVLQNQATLQRIAVVGAGVGGTELCLSLAHRLRDRDNCRLHLLYNSEHVMPGTTTKAVEIANAQLALLKVEQHAGFTLSKVTAEGVWSSNDEFLPMDKVFVSTDAVAAGWPSGSGLDCDDKGFINVNDYLQSISHDNVFAAGDIACLVNDPKPKAGVYAVRQAPYLAENLRRFFSKDAYKKVRLQSEFLRLITLGDKSAIACRNGLTLSGRWVWRWKNSIDAAFMRQFSELSKNDSMVSAAGSSTGPGVGNAEEKMHCAGCGSKLGPAGLYENLAKLPAADSESLHSALHTIEDAVVWQPSSNMAMVQSIDGFRSFTEDHYLFAMIAVHHAMNDLYAMGATPKYVQVWANLKFAHSRLQQRDHLRMMNGVSDALLMHEAALAGGHSSEGAEDHLGVVVNGELSLTNRWSKCGANHDDVIVMNKGLGTGVVLAADMQSLATVSELDSTLSSMLGSNRSLWQLLHGTLPSSVTDISGFGLIGHLLEMLPAEGFAAQLELAAIPALPGAERLIADGCHSSLFPELQHYLNSCEISDSVSNIQRDLLLDPQTNGGMLIILSRDEEKKLLDAGASIQRIGVITERATQQAQIRLH